MSFSECAYQSRFANANTLRRQAETSCSSKKQKQKQSSLKTNNFPIRVRGPYQEANLGRKLSKTLSIGQIGRSNIWSVLMLMIFGSFLLRLCVAESKLRLRVPQVLSVLIFFAWRVKRPGCRKKRLYFIYRRLMFCLRTNVMCR